MFRVSDYNIYLPLNDSDDYLIVQGAKGSFDIVDKGTVETLQADGREIENRDRISQENFDILIKRGYITEDNEDEEFKFIEKLSQAINVHGRKSINLTILPTYNCNFRCEYCFERNLQKKGAEWLKKKISSEIVDAVFLQLDDYQKQGLKLEGIYLFGGEPLLKGNRDIVDYICQKANEYELAISCISNGYDLHAYIDLIKKYTFQQVQITVDGIGREHDSRRYLVGGQPTYERIMENIEQALAEGINIVLRTNVNKKNISEMQKLIDIYKEKGWLAKSNFRYYFKSTLKCYDEIGDAYSDVELMKELAKSYDGSIEKFRFNSIYNGISDKLTYMLKNNTFAPLRSGYCGANMGMYTVDPFGDIYPCWDVLTEDDDIIGKVDVDTGRFVFNKNHDKWKARTVDRIEDCKRCKYLFFCGGGCAAQAKIVNHDMNKAYCDDFQILFNQVATEVCEEFLAS
jgi:uncharacterized protein